MVVSSQKRWRHRNAPIAFLGGRYGRSMPKSTEAVVGTRFHSSVEYCPIVVCVQTMDPSVAGGDHSGEKWLEFSGFEDGRFERYVSVCVRKGDVKLK